MLYETIYTDTLYHRDRYGRITPVSAVTFIINYYDFLFYPIILN